MRHKKFPKGVRRDVFFSTGGYCLYCNQYTPDFTVDHYVPQRLGGSRDPRNLVLACEPCNLRKAGREPREFIAAECPPGTQKRVDAYLKRQLYSTGAVA